jgi:hypothetical protein
MLPKDVYLTLAERADDKTIIQMLSVNKKFNDPKFFQLIFEKKYPLLVRFKKDIESWKNYYLRTIYYLSKLHDDYKLDYVPAPSLNPRFYYYQIKYGNNNISKLRSYISYVTETGDLNLINKHKDKFSDKYYMKKGAVRSGNIDIVKYVGDIEPEDNYLMEQAIESRNPNMVEYVLSKATEPSVMHDVYAFIGALKIADLDQAKYYEIKLRPDGYDYPMEAGIVSGDLDIFKYIAGKKNHDEGFFIAVETAIEYDHENILRYILENRLVEKEFGNDFEAEFKGKYELELFEKAKLFDSIASIKYLKEKYNF